MLHHALGVRNGGVGLRVRVADRHERRLLAVPARGDERRLVRGCITHVVTAELTVVIKRRGDLPCHHGTAFRRIRRCNAQGLGKNAEDLSFIVGYDGVIERHAHRFEVEEQATSGYKAHAPYEGRLVLETSPTASPSTDLTLSNR